MGVLVFGCAIGCAKPIYRDVNGEPMVLYWRCHEDSPHRVQLGYGHELPCPDIVEVFCPDGTGRRDRYVVVEEDRLTRNGARPPDANEMCLRIRLH
jgi:hypothetical protein